MAPRRPPKDKMNWSTKRKGRRRTLFRSQQRSGEETQVLWCTDVLQLITQRVHRLKDHNRLIRSNNNDPIKLCVVGDYGANFTKLGFLIGNVDKPGSSANFTLLGCYKGAETAACLRFAFAEVARQLSELNTIDDIPIQIFIAVDLMFLSRTYGHRGPASAFPCIVCEAQKLPSEPATARTIARMTQQAEQFQQGQQAGTNETQLSKQFGAMQFTPLFNIEPSMAIPPSLHIVACQGVFKGIFQELRHLCSRNNAEEELELRLRSLGAYKNAWYQEYSGYHVRNILRDDGPAHVTTFLPPSPQRDRIRLALELLARLQSFAAAERLDHERIINFRTTADQFRQHMQQHFAAHCTTPKFHHLVHHAPNFASEYGFWGLLSEQPMERFHADFNNALTRKANTKDMHDILMFCARESLLRNAIFDAGEM